MDQKPSKAIKIFGWLIFTFYFFACFFKINHWPGSSVLLLVGPFLMAAFYLPLWLSQSLKNRKEEQFYIIFQFAYLTFYIVGSTIKFMHWPGGHIFSNLLFWSSIFVLIPVTVVKLIRFGKRSLFEFNNLLLLFCLIISMQTGLVRGSETAVGAASLQLSSYRAEEAYEKVKIKSQQLYNAFEQLNEKDNNFYYMRSRQLKVFTDTLENYLHDLKKTIFYEIDKEHNIKFDSASIGDLWGKMDVQVVRNIMIGEDPGKLKSGRFSGRELKAMINTYRDSVIKYSDADNRSFIASGINLSTEDGETEDGERQDWIVANFWAVPAITVLMTLTNIEYEVKNAETQVLAELLNNAAKDSKENLASKIADLGYKLENEKKKREIENLQKEKELSQLKIEAKNAEIADRDKTIIYFVLVTLAFVIMIFFIVRSNIIRREINAQLQKRKEEIERQKNIIEDKQKEIVDSIQYAHRIQRALITSDRYIERELKRTKGE